MICALKYLVALRYELVGRRSVVLVVRPWKCVEPSYGEEGAVGIEVSEDPPAKTARTAW